MVSLSNYGYPITDFGYDVNITGQLINKIKVETGYNVTLMIKGIVKISLFILLFAALGAAGAYFFFEKTGFGKTGEVPSLAGKSLTEAAEILNKRKLLLNVKGGEFSEDMPEGHIITQLSAPGAKMSEGAVVDVIVSSGKTQADRGFGEQEGLLSLPSFEDQPIEDAKLTLANLNIKPGKVTWVHSDIIDKGKIIAQRGSLNGREINFLVSLGPYEAEYKCPSFVNMSPEEARALAEELGLELVEREEGNRIVSQKPEAGETIKKGDTVEITLGRSRMWF